MELIWKWDRFQYACMHGCNLKGANLSWCNLERADLSACRVDGAQLLGVRMLCASLEGTDACCSLPPPIDTHIPQSSISTEVHHKPLRDDDLVFAATAKVPHCSWLDGVRLKNNQTVENPRKLIESHQSILQTLFIKKKSTKVIFQ